eukprot:scaffold55762_cov51-Phaeocystis_antarctica.AAC.2
MPVHGQRVLGPVRAGLGGRRLGWMGLSPKDRAKRNSIRRVLESLNSPKHGCFMRTFPIHGSRAHITGIGAQNALVASAMYYIVRIRIRYIPPPAPPCS